LNIKTSEILVVNSTKNDILKNWNQQEPGLVDSTLLNKPFRKNINLRIHLTIKGHKTYINIPSELVIKELNNKSLIRLYSDLNKAFVISLLIGIVPSFIFLYLYSEILYFLISGILISLFIFGAIYYRIIKLSENYINKLKLGN